jgi:hypothetical protein
MKFTVLPCDLQDLLLDFAFKITKKELDDDLETLRVIKSWDLDPHFLQTRVWVRETWCFNNNPIETYFPLRELTSHFQLFNMCLVYELLDRLDFRKKAVRCLGLILLITSGFWVCFQFFSSMCVPIRTTLSRHGGEFHCFFKTQSSFHCAERAWALHVHVKAAFGCCGRRVRQL